MKLTPSLLIFFVLLSVPATLYARWQKLSGQYASVEYQKPYDSLAQTLLAIADAEIPRLAHLHGLSNEQIEHLPQARIILTDKPDISNGYALGNSVVIYALSSMYLPFWSEQKSWYRLVLTHELTHWVTFKALHRKLSFLGEASIALTPRWFYEGLAQYFAESWNLFRGDYYIKQALLSGQLNPNALNNLSNRRLLYASANAFVRYLAFTYGDSALIRLLRYHPHGWYYDFDDAFKAVFRKDVNLLFPDFVRASVLYYGAFLADLPVATFPRRLPDVMDQPTQVFVLSCDDSLYLAAGKEHSIDGYYSLIIVQLHKNQAHVRRRISNRLGTQVCVSADHRFIAYGEPYYSIESDQLALRFQWHIYDRKKEKSFKILTPIRSRYAAFAGNTILYLAEVLPEESRIIRFNIATEQSEIVLKTGHPVGKLTTTDTGSVFFILQSKQGKRELCRLTDKQPRVLSSEIQQPYSVICLQNRYLIFNEVRHNQPIIAVYDLQNDSVISRWSDQYMYWVQSADSTQKNFIVYRYEADGKRHFFQVPTDSVFRFSSEAVPFTCNRYGMWQRKKPFLPDTIRIKGSNGVKVRARVKHFPFTPMEHLLSFALPFYDKKYGYGFYGSTIWMEIMQRQILTAAFWITPFRPDKSVFMLKHALKYLNTDISTYVYFGPVLLTHPEGTRRQFSFALARHWFVNGNKRWLSGLKLAYNYFDHRFRKNAPYPTDRVWFHGPSVRASFRYRLPSTRNAAIPQRTVLVNAFYFTTMSGSNYKFRLIETNGMLGSKLFGDNFGIRERFSFIRQKGHLLPFQIVGIDRYYEFDMPREYLFTRTVRGLRENIDTDQLLWNSFEVRYFLTQNTGYKFLFLSVQNVTLDAFFDYGKLGTHSVRQVASTGTQLSFGDQYLRFSLGLAQTFKEWHKYAKTYFLRMAVLLRNLQ